MKTCPWSSSYSLGLAHLFAKIWSLWLLVGCAPHAPVASVGVEVARSEPNITQAWEALEVGAESLEVPLRRQALSVLIDHSTSEPAQRWAARGLWDPSPYVQRTVVASLEAHLPETLSILQDFVQREGLDPYTRCGAASGLARSGDASTAAAVQDALEAEFEQWQQAPCALALAQLSALEGGSGSARETLSAIIAEGELPMELDFIDDLGRSELPGLGAELLAVIDVVEPELQLAMATAALRLGEGGGADYLRRALSDENIELQLEAIDFLLTLPPESAAGPLRRAGGSVKTVAQLALIELGEDDPELAIESLLALDREVRAQATRALGGWLSRHDRDGPRRMTRLGHVALVEALQDPEDMVRLEALRALELAGRTEDIDAIAPLIQDDALLIRIEAADALLSVQKKQPSR